MCLPYYLGAAEMTAQSTQHFAVFFFGALLVLGDSMNITWLVEI